MEKLEDIEDKGKIVEAVGKLTKPRISAILVMYRKNVRVQTAKETLRFDFIVALKESWVLKNYVVV